jgi:membrane glycosyltransferase
VNTSDQPHSLIKQYLERTPLSADARRQLLGGASGSDPVAALHRALAGSNQESEPVLASLPTRLNWALAAAKRGDAQAATAFVQDRHGHPRLLTTPPLSRASMRPSPWAVNPFKRLARWIAVKLRGRRQVRIVSRSEKPVGPAAIKSYWRRAARGRRGILLALVIAQTVLATHLMTAILPYHGTHWLELAILVLYAILFTWVGSGFWTALMGFWVLLRGKDKYSINASTAAGAPIGASARTAILVPICNEDVARVFAGVRATYDSLARTGALAHFDFFILSDSSEADVRVAELEAWLRLCRELNGIDHIFYRRRTHRIKRKSGNIADWCRRWGSRYHYMVIFDADSVMSGPCLKRLMQLMEANPGAGIIQTAPRASGRETLYARIQQFATRIYGPLFTAGLHYWQLGESHYWGHNAIIRVAPFMDHCALGRIPGRGPLAGEILSHDFVEAALMRRAGWSVWIAYDLPGSYEEMPPTLLDELKRDRRWCQGNLQNFQLFLSKGLHPAHRAVFMTGVMAYISAPLWFLFLALSTALLAVYVMAEPVYFSEPYQLFPVWPEWHPEWALRLFGATATLLFLPKLLSGLLLLLKPGELRYYGGPARLIGSVMIEVLFSAVLAPIRMLFHTQFVITALLGFAMQWKSPPREDAETPWGEALRRHGAGTVLGVAWTGGVYWLNPSFVWWLLPVAGSLILAIPLSVWSSRVSLGRWFRARRYFLIPEESAPPRELRWTRAGVRRAEQLEISDGFRRAVTHPTTQALVSAYAHRRDKRPAAVIESRRDLLQSALLSGPAALNEIQRNAILGDPVALAQLHLSVWSDPLAHADWLHSATSGVTKP